MARVPLLLSSFILGKNIPHCQAGIMCLSLDQLLWLASGKVWWTKPGLTAHYKSWECTRVTQRKIKMLLFKRNEHFAGKKKNPKPKKLQPTLDSHSTYAKPESIFALEKKTKTSHLLGHWNSALLSHCFSIWQSISFYNLAS